MYPQNYSYNPIQYWNRLAVLLSILVLIGILGSTLKDHMFASIEQILQGELHKEISYKVSAGDTLWAVAANNLEPGEDVRNKIIEIRRLNGLTPTQNIKPGQIIRISIKQNMNMENRLTMNNIDHP